MSGGGVLVSREPGATAARPSRGLLPKWLTRFVKGSTLGTASALFLLLIVVVAIFANVLAPHDPMMNNYQYMVKPPSETFWLGNDQLGRDVFSRLLLGIRTSLFIALVAVLLGDSIGFVLGVVTGYRGGKLDLFAQRILDILMSFPGLILAMVLMVGLGAGIQTVIIAIGIERVPAAARVIRSVALSVKEMAFVDAARVTGASQGRVMLRHIAPQCVAPMLVIFSLHIGSAMFTEAALSFLGIGVPAPTPSLGNMLGEQVSKAFQPPWWLVLFPGVTITAIILAANLLGDSVRDFLDPKLRQR